MLKKNAQPLSEALSDFFDEHSSLRVKLAEQRAVRGWSELLGEGVSQYTRNVYFSQHVLYVQLSSAVLRAELIMNKEELIKKLNEHAEAPIVRDIVFR
jgi:predicted nucleic acid-binding Zn ribbon protein